jgi:hypothetical protein
VCSNTDNDIEKLLCVDRGEGYHANGVILQQLKCTAAPCIKGWGWQGPAKGHVLHARTLKVVLWCLAV